MESVLDKKTNVYFGYYTRLCFNLLAYLVLFGAAVFFFIFSFDFSEVQTVNYKESSNLNYWVYVHENEFYEQNFLEKDMVYIANLIDKIVIDFDYNFLTETKETLDLIYDIKADLLITDSEGKIYYKKSYDLLEDKKYSIVDNNLSKINEQVTIDYKLYNDLANKFKTAYGVDAKSILNVYMNINKSTNEKSNFNLNSSNSMKVSIPLTQSSVDIKLDYLDINASDVIVKDRTFNFKSIFMFSLSILSFLLSICMLILFVRKLLLLRSKKNKFDKVVDKILKEYDFYIAETSTLISFEGKEIVKVEKFTELLDIHDNLKQPIMYYLVNKHQKCYFYINHKNIVYLVVVKAADLESKDFIQSIEERKKKMLLNNNSFANKVNRTFNNNSINSNDFKHVDKNNLSTDTIVEVSDVDDDVTNISSDTGIYNFDMSKTENTDVSVVENNLKEEVVSINENKKLNNVSPSDASDVVIKKVEFSDINNDLVKNVEMSNANNKEVDFMDMPVLKDNENFEDEII